MSAEQFKNQAARLSEHLATVYGFKLKRAGALEAVAASLGFADWNTLAAVGAQTAEVAGLNTGVPVRYSRDRNTQRTPLMRNAACAAVSAGRQVVYLGQFYDPETAAALQASAKTGALRQNAIVLDASTNLYNPLAATTVGQVVEKLMLLQPHIARPSLDVQDQRIQGSLSFCVHALAASNSPINVDSIIGACRTFEHLDGLVRTNCSLDIVEQWDAYIAPWKAESPTSAHLEDCRLRSLGGLWGRLHLLANEMRKLRDASAPNRQGSPSMSGEQLLNTYQVLYVGRQGTSEMLNGWYANCLAYDLKAHALTSKGSAIQLYLDGMYHGHCRRIALQLLGHSGVSVAECPIASPFEQADPVENLTDESHPFAFSATPINPSLLSQ